MAEDILAPMAGSVLAIKVQVGQEVKEDDDAFVIEAMKMESTIYIPCDGTIKDIKVSVGDEFDEDDVLGVIE